MFLETRVANFRQIGLGFTDAKGSRILSPLVKRIAGQIPEDGVISLADRYAYEAFRTWSLSTHLGEPIEVVSHAGHVEKKWQELTTDAHGGHLPRSGSANELLALDGLRALIGDSPFQDKLVINLAPSQLDASSGGRNKGGDILVLERVCIDKHGKDIFVPRCLIDVKSSTPNGNPQTQGINTRLEYTIPAITLYMDQVAHVGSLHGGSRRNIVFSQSIYRHLLLQLDGAHNVAKSISFSETEEERRKELLENITLMRTVFSHPN